MKTITNDAPDITEGYPSKGRLVGPAWQKIWGLLREVEGDHYLDGREMVNEVAAGFEGMGSRKVMSPETLINLLLRATNAGILERTYREGTGTRGRRMRAWYRIKKDA